jgi:tryptophan synthase alpha chain
MRFSKNIFMPFVVLGDPTYEQSIELVKTLIDHGAGSLELGFAFSDPIADGQTIQKANKRALDDGITTKKSFDILRKIRNYFSIPISLMLSFNIVYNYGTEDFYKKCNELKIDAVLCPDVPLEESEDLVKYSKRYGLNQIFIVSPTTTDDRMKQINTICSGYVYLVSLLGTTGIRDKINIKLADHIKRTKANIDLPVYVGFGISKPEHVKKILNDGADGVICGSAFCRLIESNLNNFDKMIKDVGDFCQSMQNNEKTSFFKVF